MLLLMNIGKHEKNFFKGALFIHYYSQINHSNDDINVDAFDEKMPITDEDYMWHVKNLINEREDIISIRWNNTHKIINVIAVDFYEGEVLVTVSHNILTKVRLPPLFRTTNEQTIVRKNNKDIVEFLLCNVS